MIQEFDSGNHRLPRVWSKVYANPSAGLRLYLLPPAGGGTAQFSALTSHPQTDFEFSCMLYPGRESRRAEAPIANMEELVSGIVHEIMRAPKEPFGLLGHSFGAIVAYEVCSRLVEIGHHPACLVALSQGSPNWKMRQSAKLGLDKFDFSIYDHPVREDMEMRRDYSATPRSKRSTFPILAISGTNDDRIDPKDVDDWRNFTTGRFAERYVPADHFSILDMPVILVGELYKFLQREKGSPFYMPMF